MNLFPFYIARRYLLSKKSHHVINVISIISMLGVAFATAALVCILSVFNGFRDMVADLFSAFDPDLKIVPARGKFMDADADVLRQVKNDENTLIYTEVVEENALIMHNNRQLMVTIKGVDDNFNKLIPFQQIKQGSGDFCLHAANLEYAIPGINILQALGVGADFNGTLQVYAPRSGERLSMTDPTENFNVEELYSSKLYFSVKQVKYDSKYVITSKALAQRLFEKDGQVSAVELRLPDGAEVEQQKSHLEELLGKDYKILTRYEQQADTFKIMQIEKLISYIFLTFVLLIASFNIIGSLSMLIIDKKDDVITLRNLGADDAQISRVFMLEGRLASVIGAVLGIVIGLSLCLLQQHYGFIRFGDSAGSYIIDAYPVAIHLTDIVIIFVTVIIVGFVSVWYPVKRGISRLF